MYRFNPLTGKMDDIGDPVDGGLVYSYPTGAPLGKGKIQSFFETSINYTTKQYDSGLLLSYPIIIKQDVTIEQLRIGISTPAVGNLVYGLYNQGTDGLPDELLFQSTPFNTNVGGTAIYTLGTPQEITKGLYWVAYNTDSAAFGPATFISGVLANIWSDMSPSQYSYYYKAKVYDGTLPATFGGSTFITTGYTTINFCEFIIQ